VIAGVHAVLEEQVARDVVAGETAVGHIFPRGVGRLVRVGRGIDEPGGLGRGDVLHHQVAARIADPQRLAFGVEFSEGHILFVVQDGIPIAILVMSDRDYRGRAGPGS
jgi:hypothetical protein